MRSEISFGGIGGKQSFIALGAGFDRFGEGFGTVAIHRHLTHLRTHAGLLEEAHQQTGTLSMNRCEYAGTHGTEAPEVADKATVHPFGIGRVGIFHFLRKGVVLEPRQQFQIHRDALVAILRGMHVQVVHSGDQQTVAEVGDFCILSV